VTSLARRAASSASSGSSTPFGRQLKRAEVHPHGPGRFEVNTALAPFTAGGGRGRTSMRRGHFVRRSSSERGRAEKGWPADPFGLRNRRPSKWSLVAALVANL